MALSAFIIQTLLLVRRGVHTAFGTVMDITGAGGITKVDFCYQLRIKGYPLRAYEQPGAL